MTQEKLHTVVCELTEQEYLHQMALSQAQPRRPAPKLMRHTPAGHTIGEHHIGRITVDAWAAATALEASNIIQDRIEEETAQWPLDRKLAFLDAAGAHWIPPLGEETCYWNGTSQEAQNLLEQYPSLLSALEAGHAAGEPAAKAAAAAVLMDEMQHYPYDSADWQERWDRVRATLAAIADASPPEEA